MASPSDPILLDVSRLVWRRWAGHRPTGIDRVCLAWLDHFGPRAHAVVQWRGRVRVLHRMASLRLFALLRGDGGGFRRALLALLPTGALPHGLRLDGMVYANVGHTGLDRPRLARWIMEHRLRAVMLVHDLIPITHPQFCRMGEADRHARRMDLALRSASAIIANSAATRADLVAYARAQSLPCPILATAWLAPPPWPDPAQVSFDRPWFVVTGTIEGRKNHAMLLDVWHAWAQSDAAPPMLVIAGRRGWQADAVHERLDRDRALRGHVVEWSDPDDATLAGLVRGARALLMPSFAEGFGLPVIEALRAGTPVIASDLAVFREIAGGIPRYCRPDDPAAWGAAVRAYAEDSGERARQIAAIGGFRTPSWTDHFARVEGLLAELGTRPKGLAA